MSFSVDDLVSSFNASHIGQEARDLAALQAQLAEALFGVSSSAFQNSSPSFPPSTSAFYPSSTPRGRGRSQHAQACNTTPLASRAPSLSVRFGGGGRRGNGNAAEYEDMGMDEDERMVEELLLLPPTSPSSTSTSYSNSTTNINPYPSSFSPPPSTPTTPSLFATTDPFYQAQAQAAQAFSNNATRNYTALASGNGGFNSGFSFGGDNSSGMNMNGVQQNQQPQTFQTQWGEVQSYKQCAAAF